MCKELIIDGEAVTGLRRLRELLGRESVVIRDGYAPGIEDSCLCPVDFEATARKCGRRLAPVDKPFAVYELVRL